LLLSLAVCLSGAAAFGADQLDLEVSPGLDGYASSSASIPVAVDIKNDGPDTRGMLIASSGTTTISYPVDLPRGSQKHLLTYPSTTYGTIDFTLKTDHDSVSKKFEPRGGRGGQTKTVLVITDTPGDFAFIRGKDASVTQKLANEGVQQSVIGDAYVSAKYAPARPVGYVNMACVVLGPGSERLTDEQVSALKLYTLTGGALLFIGGPSAPILDDPRWQDLLPAHAFHVTTLEHSATLSELGNEKVPTVTVMNGTPIPGAIARMDGSTLISAERYFGVGRVAYASFNPFDAPLNRWNGRQLAVSRLLRVVDSYRTGTVLDQFGGATDVSNVQNDPFSAELPPPNKVIYILIGYFVMVVPFNFIVLRRLKRGELAWFTAPVISLAFAGIFFASAGNLYAAKQSTATTGALFMESGFPTGVFIGSSDMFFPHGGSFDLKLHGIDSLGLVRENDMYSGYGGRGNEESLEAIDVGELQMPEMSADNLAFRNITYRQIVPATPAISISVNPKGKTGGTCTITNGSPYPLKNAVLNGPFASVPVPSLPAGESKTVDLKGTASQTPQRPADRGSAPGMPPGSAPQDVVGMGVEDIFRRGGGVSLVGTLEGFRPGPQIGELVAGRSTIRIVVVAKEAFGPK